jgi:drug/metabolite transporter (DMT)-like permease
MNTAQSNKAPALLVILSFATVFIVWGSTYFFISVALHGFPPMLMGAIRFISAGLLMIGGCALKGDRLWNRKEIAHSAICGLLMLFVATGLVILAERNIPTAMVAIMIAASPIWFVALDRSNWAANFKNKTTVYGLGTGFIGILLLFGESLLKAVSGTMDHQIFFGFLMMIASPVAWSAGSLYAKKSSGAAPARLTTAWQMIIAGLAYLPGAAIHQEFASFHPGRVPQQAWLAMGYLIVFGSIAAFSAYIWLLKVRPATQVSMYAYVNPIIAVLLGVFFAQEKISGFQIFGLIIILFSVLLVNLSRYGIPDLKKLTLKLLMNKKHLNKQIS